MHLAEYCFHENEHLMILGRNDDIRKLVKKYPS
jgi:hypothetical protein